MAEEAAKKAKEGGGEKRAHRATSNVFALFPQHQIQEFKEAFTMIDQNRDGFIDIEDLKDMYASLGREPKDDELKAMLKEAPDKLNFTAFLTLFGEKLHGTDSEETMRNAFRMFDEEQKGYLEEEYIKELLTTMGDNFTKEEIKQTWKEAPIDGGHFDYNSFVTVIKRGKEDE
ncbi:myosin regulatory light chain, smooth muscle-like isoform X2 [Tubulanus polymorphus]|uniref:myosin regulatory light chain, smooth muscle-like isoform X2 n=1 Tax=Tubulanus polymorphus TaxID=672921 RepID=UPI003DA56AC5